MLFVLPRLFACAQRNVPLCSPQQLRTDIIIYFHQMLQERSHSAPCRAELRPQMASRKYALSAALGRAPPACVRVPLCTWRSQQRKPNAPSFNASNVRQRSSFCHGQLYLHLSVVTNLCHTHTRTHTDRWRACLYCSSALCHLVAISNNAPCNEFISEGPDNTQKCFER